jgi:hypothetical protein
MLYNSATGPADSGDLLESVVYKVKMESHSGSWIFAAADGHPADRVMRAADTLHFESAKKLADLVVRRGYAKPEIVWYDGPGKVIRMVTAPVAIK